MTRSRRDPHSWTVVPLPERDLAEVVLDFAAPLLVRLGPAPTIEAARGALALAVTFWNAHVLASNRWEYPRLVELKALKTRMRGRQASKDDAATFDLLTERWREHWLDPRLVETWTYGADAGGNPQFVCTMGLPDGVEALLPPPIEKRIAIGGRFLDEVRISKDGNTSLSFPVERHSGTIGEDGVATIHAMMPSALQLFAEGRLPPVSGGQVEIAIGGRMLGPMVLAAIQCGCESLRHDVAILVFKPAAPTAVK